MDNKNNTTCLGRQFDSEEDRRNHFREELRSMIPELKLIEGFPIGEDENILNLSDPPYYTVCPNPWLNDFISEWEKEKQELEINGKRIPECDIKRNPYSGDVREGKNNPVYNAHSYHTKVPHPAIMRYILHYTQPGDIVLDGFAGTGMTGVAASVCGNPDAATRARIEQEFMERNMPAPVWGTRRAICGDLSPIASFIAYNYNNPVDAIEFEQEAKRVLEEVEKECAWLYQTRHIDGSMCTINYTVWSDVFRCPNCSGEIVFYEAAVDTENSRVMDLIPCPHCGAENTKRKLEKIWVALYDEALEQNIKQTKTVPVLISYTCNKKRYKKVPDEFDLQLIKKIEETPIHYWFPKDRMPEGEESRRNDRFGITHVHHFYTKRNLWALSTLWDRMKIKLLNWASSSIGNYINKKQSYFGGGGGVNGTYYIPSLIQEKNVFDVLFNKINRILDAFTYDKCIHRSVLVFSNSITDMRLMKQSSIDYIFTDPPFGSNIMYSELNFIWESWLGVKTNNASEAIENKTQKKTLREYGQLMERAFCEYFRVLKPGKWMTVEFSNTNAEVWNSIQYAIRKAGFIIASVSALDKKQGSFKSVTTSTAVKQDLVLSCYKPSERLIQSSTTLEEVNVWDFVLEHLQHLPVHVQKGNNTTVVVERSAKVLYDRMIAFYLMRGLKIPIDAKDFHNGLAQRFIMIDGMYFTEEQASEYDNKKSETVEGVETSLFVDVQ